MDSFLRKQTSRQSVRDPLPERDESECRERLSCRQELKRRNDPSKRINSYQPGQLLEVYKKYTHRRVPRRPARNPFVSSARPSHHQCAPPLPVK